MIFLVTYFAGFLNNDTLDRAILGVMILFKRHIFLHKACRHFLPGDLPLRQNRDGGSDR